MNRIQREKRTVSAMLYLYCSGKHGTPKGQLCSQCEQVRDYAMIRLDKCMFGEHKPTCGKCPVHCYKPAIRQKIVEVMRFAGPRMIYSHPMLVLAHLVDGFSKAKRNS